METTLNFEGSLTELLEHVRNKFPEIDWSIHESEAYFTGYYILGRTGEQKITIEVKEEGKAYELAIQ
jgi:hypothetical protein